MKYPILFSQKFQIFLFLRYKKKIFFFIYFKEKILKVRHFLEVSILIFQDLENISLQIFLDLHLIIFLRNMLKLRNFETVFGIPIRKLQENLRSIP